MPRIIKDYEVVYPPLLKAIRNIQNGFYDHTGHMPVILETWRHPKRQAELYSYGRTITQKRKVTNAGPWESHHQYGLAVDIVMDKRPDKKGIQDPYGAGIDWPYLGELCRQQGCEWGGKWGDYGHIQWPIPFSFDELQSIHDEHGMQGVWLSVTMKERFKYD